MRVFSLHYRTWDYPTFAHKMCIEWSDNARKEFKNGCQRPEWESAGSLLTSGGARGLHSRPEFLRLPRGAASGFSGRPRASRSSLISLSSRWLSAASSAAVFDAPSPGPPRITRPRRPASPAWSRSGPPGFESLHASSFSEKWVRWLCSVGEYGRGNHRAGKRPKRPKRPGRLCRALRPVERHVNRLGFEVRRQSPELVAEVLRLAGPLLAAPNRVVGDRVQAFQQLRRRPLPAAIRARLQERPGGPAQGPLGGDAELREVRHAQLRLG